MSSLQGQIFSHNIKVEVYTTIRLCFSERNFLGVWLLKKETVK